MKSAKNRICCTCAENSLRYQFSDILLHTVVISRKTVKSVEITICDSCAQNSQKHESSDILAYTVVLSRKTVKSPSNKNL